MTNIHPTTGIRYGVISGDSLHPEVLDDMYLLASDSVSDALEAERRSELTKALITAVKELLPHVPVDATDVADLVDQQIDWEAENIPTHYFEPDAEIEYEGYKLRYCYLGGAPIVFVLEGPTVVYANALCSPCVPNAADLDSGFSDEGGDGYLCYGVPEDWLDKEDSK